MNSKQRKTMDRPTPKNLMWNDLESLFKGLGFMVIEGDGSKVSFEKDAASISFHRPHPQKEAKPYQIQAVRDFFEEMGKNHDG